MKPGSSDRCKSHNPDVTLRCRLHKDHAGEHQAKRGKTTVRWTP